MITVNTTYAGDPSEVAAQDWLILEQTDIPQSQQICTINDLKSLLSVAMSGQSALSYVSENCPVSERLTSGGKVMASYKATVYVHHSEGLDYDLTPSEGDISMRFRTTVQKNESYDLRYEAFKGLGWRPETVPQYTWLTRVRDQNGLRVFSPKDPTQDNGYLYFDQGYKGTLKVSGGAAVDRYTVTIEHQKGYKYDKTILLTAEWGPEDADGNRESAQIEIGIPTCVKDEFEKCATDKFSDFGKPDDGIGDEDEIGAVKEARKRVYIGKCTGKELGVEKIYE